MFFFLHCLSPARRLFVLCLRSSERVANVTRCKLDVTRYGKRDSRPEKNSKKSFLLRVWCREFRTNPNSSISLFAHDLKELWGLLSGFFDFFSRWNWFQRWGADQCVTAATRVIMWWTLRSQWFPREKWLQFDEIALKNDSYLRKTAVYVLTNMHMRRSFLVVTQCERSESKLLSLRHSGREVERTTNRRNIASLRKNALSIEAVTILRLKWNEVFWLIVRSTHHASCDRYIIRFLKHVCLNRKE